MSVPVNSPCLMERDVVLSKCRSVIDALHAELEEERERGDRLERSLMEERQLVRQLETDIDNLSASLKTKTAKVLQLEHTVASSRDKLEHQIFTLKVKLNHLLDQQVTSKFPSCLD